MLRLLLPSSTVAASLRSTCRALHHRVVAPATAAGTRLDRFVADVLALPRSRVSDLFKAGLVASADDADNGARTRPARKLSGGEVFLVTIDDEEDVQGAANEGGRTSVDDPLAREAAKVVRDARRQQHSRQQQPPRPAFKSDETADDGRTPPSIPPGLRILHEDEHVIVVDKPAGLVVHPSKLARSGASIRPTLCHYLLDRLAPGLPRPCSGGDPLRPGVVHRLDAGTSGVMVMGKTQYALEHLSRQFRDRTARRRYLAVVWGNVEGDAGTIDAALQRHPTRWLRFMVAPPERGSGDGGGSRVAPAKTSGGTGRGGGAPKRAVTHWRAAARARFPAKNAAGSRAGRKAGRNEGHLTLMECRLETGRTHQVRLHMSHIGHPLVGDPTYDRPRYRLRPEDAAVGTEDVAVGSQAAAAGVQIAPAGEEETATVAVGEVVGGEAGNTALAGALEGQTAQLLHAYHLGFEHPGSGVQMWWESPPPRALREVVSAADWTVCDDGLGDGLGDVESGGDSGREGRGGGGGSDGRDSGRALIRDLLVGSRCG